MWCLIKTCLWLEHTDEEDGSYSETGDEEADSEDGSLLYAKYDTCWL